MKSEWLTTASTLSKALPYLQRYDGATVVIKFGGHAMGSDAAMESFARDVVLMQQVGVNPVIVHGGGPMINEMLKRLDIQSHFVDGKRVTDAATMEVVEMVLSGRVNKRIVQAINAQGGRAVGLSGKDASLMTCDVADPKLGLVGKPRDIDPTVLKTFFDADMIPVIAPLGAGDAGETFNINGDTVAGAIAAALKADQAFASDRCLRREKCRGRSAHRIVARHHQRLDRQRCDCRRHDPQNRNRAGSDRGRCPGGGDHRRARAECLSFGIVHGPRGRIVDPIARRPQRIIGKRAQMSQDALMRLAIFLGLFAILAGIEHLAPRRPRPQKTRRWITNWVFVVVDTLTLRALGDVSPIRRRFGRRGCQRPGLGPPQPCRPARLGRVDCGHPDDGSRDLGATFAEP